MLVFNCGIVSSLDESGREIRRRYPLALPLRRMATRTFVRAYRRGLRRDIAARPIDKAASTIFVVMPNPVSESEVRPGLVASLRCDVEIHIRAQHFLVATAITGVGMEDVAVCIFVEDAHAGKLLDRCIG